MNPNQETTISVGSQSNVKLHKIEPARVIYFFEREDGTRIHCHAEEAWGLYIRKPQIIGVDTRKMKFIGQSDGKDYYDAVLGLKVIFAEKGLEAAQNHLREAEKVEFQKALQNKTPPPNLDKKYAR